MDNRFTFKCTDNNCSIFENGVWLKVEEVVEELNSLSNVVLAYDKTVAELRKENERLKRENDALESNVEWFAHQLEKHYTLYSDDFLETLETIEGEETVEKIRERQNEIIKILKKE